MFKICKNVYLKVSIEFHSYCSFLRIPLIVSVEFYSSQNILILALIKLVVESSAIIYNTEIDKKKLQT